MKKFFMFAFISLFPLGASASLNHINGDKLNAYNSCHLSVFLDYRISRPLKRITRRILGQKNYSVEFLDLGIRAYRFRSGDLILNFSVPQSRGGFKSLAVLLQEYSPQEERETLTLESYKGTFSILSSDRAGLRRALRKLPDCINY